MKKLLIAMITLAISSCQVMPVNANTRTEVNIKDNRVTVKQNGVTKNYGSINRIKNNYKGDVEVYTNRSGNNPAITVDKDGDISTKEDRNANDTLCTYGCEVNIK